MIPQTPSRRVVWRWLAGISVVVLFWCKPALRFDWAYFLLYALYVAYFGLCLAAGSLLPELKPRYAVPLVLLLAALLAREHQRIEPHALKWYRETRWQVDVPARDLQRLLPDLTILARLIDRDPEVDVWRAKRSGQLPAEQCDAVFRMTKDGIERVR